MQSLTMYFLVSVIYHLTVYILVRRVQLIHQGSKCTTHGGLIIYLSQFSPLIFPFFPNDENSGYLNDIKFIFGRCHSSWAAETPGKYEHDWKYLTYTFTKP